MIMVDPDQSKFQVLCFIIGNPKVRPLASFDDLRLLGLSPQLSSPKFLERHPPNFSAVSSRIKMRRQLVLAEIGCALAHLETYRILASLGNRWALILEDDAKLNLDSREQFLNALKHIDRLESEQPEGARVYSFFSRSALVFDDNCTELFREVVGFPSEAVAYVINQKAAAILLETNRNLDYVADWPRNTKIDFFLSSNEFFIHKSGEDKAFSLIDHARIKNAPTLVQKTIMAISTVSFYYYFKFKRQFSTIFDYSANLVWPIIKFRIARIGSVALQPGVPNLRKMSPFNPISLIRAIRRTLNIP
jgi:GR25 family glycosyltransferase involved in LPS biosynthesis